MKLPISCHICLQEHGLGDEFPMAMLSPTNDGRYVYTCPRGHTGTTILQQDRFQLLFQIGIHALVDGYPREAVADFTASLERFYEFFFHLTCRLRGIAADAKDRTWAAVSRQSERQLGLFLASYLNVFGVAGPTLSGKQVEFRNDIIHKGRIPTTEEAIAFGEAVSELMSPIMIDLQSQYADTLQQMDFARIIRAADGKPAATMSYPTFLNFQVGAATNLRDAISTAGKPPWNYR